MNESHCQEHQHRDAWVEGNPVIPVTISYVHPHALPGISEFTFPELLDRRDQINFPA